MVTRIKIAKFKFAKFNVRQTFPPYSSYTCNVYYANVSYALQDECLIPILQALKFSMQNRKAQNGPGDKVAYM